MPASKSRKKGTTRPRRRDKAAEARARATQAAQREAGSRKLTPGAYRRRRVLGWTLVGLGAAVFMQHLISHMGSFNLISPGWDDLVVGYPMAGLLGVVGAIVLTKT